MVGPSTAIRSRGQALVAAIRAVGTSAKKVEAYLKEKFRR
jgi:hypothetical protein